MPSAFRWHRKSDENRGGGAILKQPAAPLEGRRPLAVCWYKCSDLRLLDHEPLVRAHRWAAERGGEVLHLHLLEQEHLLGRSRVAKLPRCSSRRAVFWRESVEDLERQLASRGQMLLLMTVRSEPPGGVAAVFARLCTELCVRIVFAHSELCDEEIRTEEEVRKTLSQHGATLDISWGGLTMHHIEDLRFDPSDRQQMPLYKGEYQKLVRAIPLRSPLPVPNLSPAPMVPKLGFIGNVAEAFAEFGNHVWKPPAGFGKDGVEWIGGETQALAFLRQYIWEQEGLKTYVGATESHAHKAENAVNSGSRLSPWIAFGCLSPRNVMKEVKAYERSKGKSGSTQRLFTELVFRDFLRFSLLTWGTSVFRLHGPFHVKGLEWRKDAGLFDRWRRGLTGFPFVDAGMRELAATGYISHLHRQCCAAFLVRDLRLDWRMGAEHFEATLLDHTPDANWGNWAYRILPRPCLATSMALAEAARTSPHVMTLEILAWPVVHDARLEHIWAWLPELRRLPRDLAREPWRLESRALQGLPVAPFKDSPLWFCAANRVNWDYEYYWLCGHAWSVEFSQAGSSPPGPGDSVNPVNSVAFGASDFQLSRDYPRPLVPPLNLEVDLDKLPLDHGWGDTPSCDRPHVWGRRGKHAGEASPELILAEKSIITGRRWSSKKHGTVA